ncbi:glycerophosphodiester phosphodiesterase family protein [Janibacter cremeus]|nr:glycerophosphodiester phosphodiesterase family protein [Janibacter cremeus]WEV79340.1 glycerophosphodiester phosphodiesterase family protein [Janibacter cremeus]
MEMGADYIEPDLVMTKDSVLVVRHEPEITATTDVAEHPEFADRRTTKKVHGKPVTGWFVDDFTLEELKTLRATERLGQERPTSARFDGHFTIPAFEEVLVQREVLARESGRQIGIIPEIKHSTYLHDNGFDPEAELTRLVDKYSLNSDDAPIWVQSFELTALKDLRAQGYRGKSTFLTSRRGGPYDLRRQGTTYAELTTFESMRGLARWIDGISPDKKQIIPWEADGTLGEATALVANAHAAGLEVTPWGFRASDSSLPGDPRTAADSTERSRMVDEVESYLRAGVDGVFCDQPDLCVQARSQFVTAR